MAGTGEGWQNQGRQEHGWFGHGTGPGQAAAPSEGGLFGPGHIEERTAAVSLASLAALPRSLRGQAGMLHEFGAAKRLEKLLTRWSGAMRLNEAAFAGHFFDRSPDDRAVQALHAAVAGISTAQNYDDLRGASEQVATAMQAVGLGSWSRFLADAQDRADDPATLAAVATSQAQPALPPVSSAAMNQPALKAPIPAITLVADDEPPASASEPEHGGIWQWLHGLGLAKTRHEQATELRRAMGAAGGLVYMRDGIALDVDQMSDDEVLALDRETRGQRHLSPLVGAAAPIMTQWGWKDSPLYKKAKDQLRQPGTHETLQGRVPPRRRQSE